MRNLAFATFSCLAATMLASCGEPVVSPGGMPPSPSIGITAPPATGEVSSYSTYIDFEWQPQGENPAVCTRYIWGEIVDTSGVYSPGFDFISDLNENAWRYEDRWSSWACLSDKNDPGWRLVLGDDEQLYAGRYHFLAVQSRDGNGNTDTIFAKNVNVRHFIPRRLNEPFLKIYEPLLGGFRFVGTTMNPAKVKAPPGTSLKFRWKADPSRYFSELKGYRYGWDISDPESWDEEFSAGTRSTTEVKFNSGNHTLFIEASDIAGNISLARISVEIVPWTMDRDLLWVDDFVSVDMPIPDFSWPPEYEHDRFWVDICSRAPGFEPLRDIYECREAHLPPGMELIGRYKNLVWTFSTQGAEWADIVSFVPESRITLAEPSTANLISIFIRKGGHVWTLGRSDHGSGLAAVQGEASPEFPFRVDREIAGAGTDDPSGTESMVWRDYCVTVIDKVQANFRDHSWMPERRLDHHDVFRTAFLDEGDPVTASSPGFPPDLHLREEVVAKGSFFSFDSLSSPGGFTFVEVYDPAYWMNINLLVSRHCFHPLYRMRAADEGSPIHQGVVAIWLTEYEQVIAEGIPGAVPAPSVHFGFPLWFFRETTVDSIADAIFDIWMIGGG